MPQLRPNGEILRDIRN